MGFAAQEKVSDTAPRLQWLPAMAATAEAGVPGLGLVDLGLAPFSPFRFCYVSIAQFDVGFWRGRVWREKGVTPLVRCSLARVD
jgi:hypothetical protein